MNYVKASALNLLLICLALVLLGIVSLPEKKNLSGSQSTAAEEKAQYEEIPLVDRKVGEIAAVALIREDARFGVLHKEGRIALEPSPENLVLSTEKMQSFLYRMSKLSAFARVEDAESGDYGFDAPRSQITLILTDGSKIRLALGRENPLDGSSYLQIEGSDEVYLLKGDDVLLLLSEPRDFTDSNLLPSVELEELNSVQKLSLAFPGGSLPGFVVENKGNFSFCLAEPYRGSLDYEQVLSKLIFPVLSLTAENGSENIPAAPSLPDASVEIVLDGTAYNVDVFAADGELYAVRNGEVHLLAADDLPFLSLHYRDMLDGSAYHINISEIKSLRIRSGGKDFNVELSGESTELEAAVNGTVLAYPEAVELLDLLFETGIAGEREETVLLKGNEQISLSIEIVKKNGAREILDFVSQNKDQLLYINGEARFTTYNKTVSDIRRVLEEIEAGGSAAGEGT